MSIDDPFAEPEESERTVILPKPGGRKAEARIPEAELSEPSKPDLPPLGVHSPAFDVEASPARPKAARIFDKDAEWQRNPLLAAALPLLELVVQIRTRPAHFDVEVLREHVAREIKNFDRKIAPSGLSPRVMRGARYALCAAIDDVVLNTPQGGRSAWTQRGMVATFHHEVVGGDRLWELLDQLKKEPANNLDLLELIYYCISLGFEGRYRVLPRGSSELTDVRQDLFRLIRNNRGAVEREVSPRWKPAPPAGRGLRDILPNWMVALLALAFLTVVYAIFSITMSSASDKATSALLKLHGGGAPKIARAEPVEPLAPPPPSDIAEKVSVLLEKERAEGLVEVEDGSGFFVIRLMKDGMFRSGSAELDPSLKPLIERVAAELDQEAGPIRIVGHTDNIPMKKLFGAPYQDNFQLSEARARNVAVLFARSISDAKRLTAEGKADQEPRPSADNATEEGRARNRRIEIVLEAV